MRAVTSDAGEDRGEKNTTTIMCSKTRIWARVNVTAVRPATRKVCRLSLNPGWAKGRQNDAPGSPDQEATGRWPGVASDFAIVQGPEWPWIGDGAPREGRFGPVPVQGAISTTVADSKNRGWNPRSSTEI